MQRPSGPVLSLCANVIKWESMSSTCCSINHKYRVLKMKKKMARWSRSGGNQATNAGKKSANSVNKPHKPQYNTYRGQHVFARMHQCWTFCIHLKLLEHVCFLRGNRGLWCCIQDVVLTCLYPSSHKAHVDSG